MCIRDRLYKYGKKIFDKIMAAMQPEFEDEEPINPFDFWQGADFKIKIKKVAGYWNYDSSEFARQAPLLDGDDDALEALWKTEHSLAELVAADKFKDYDALKKRLDYVLGIRGVPKMQDQETVEEEQAFERERRGEGLDSLSEGRGSFNDPDITPTVSRDEDEDDALSYFQKLAGE